MSVLEDRVKLTLSKELGVPLEKIVGPKSLLGDYGADSLDVVSMLITLEEGLGIEISDEDAKKIKTVQDVIDYVNQKSSVINS